MSDNLQNEDRIGALVGVAPVDPKSRLALYPEYWRVYIGPFAEASLSAKNDAVRFVLVSMAIVILLNVVGLGVLGASGARGAVAVLSALCFLAGMAAGSVSALISCMTMMTIERRIARARDIRIIDLDRSFGESPTGGEPAEREAFVRLRDRYQAEADGWRRRGMACLAGANLGFVLGGALLVAALALR